METSPKLMKTAYSGEHGHRLHHPCPSGIPEIGLEKRKWVVLAPSLRKIPSKCVFLCLYSLTAPQQRLVLGHGGCTTSKGGKEWRSQAT